VSYSHANITQKVFMYARYKIDWVFWDYWNTAKHVWLHC